MPNLPLTQGEIAELQAQLHDLQTEHRDLDNVINRLALSPPPDELLIRRLKKRKLSLKDRIQHLERLLVPDVPA
ncbi:MAG: YdcH family protein [Betaproteobacteria bacterium]